jgi:sigma-B regulation protein RsbU (phosphoserine phosphatase)
MEIATMTTSVKKSSKHIKDLKLNALLEVTKAINNNYSTDQLIEIFRNVLHDELDIPKMVLFGHDNGWKCFLKYGAGNELSKINVERDLIQIKDYGSTNDLSLPDNIKKNFDVIIPVYHKQIPLAYALIGDIAEKRGVGAGIKHLNFIQTLTSIIVVAIENKKLAKENIRQAAIKRELELASEMQSMLFPSTLPSNKIIDAAAFYQPHQQVGGDYYDFVWLNENECVFCVADVSGKGVAAALLMSNFQANLRILLNHTPSFTQLIKELNTKVMHNAKGEKFITLFIAKYNTQTRVLSYINAAHNPPLLVNGDKVEILNTGCTGLGMFDEITKINEGAVIVAPGTTIVCYTDGLVELENDAGEDFGIDKLKDIVLKNQKLGMKELNKIIMETLIDYKENQPYIDDIALFSFKAH